MDNIGLGSHHAPIRLLIVDDELHIRTALKRTLGLVGYVVDDVASGEEGLALLRHSQYDLMVLDMILPDMSGVNVLHQARQIQADLIIIVLTGNATLESAITAVKSSVTDYLLKPVSLQDIIDAITLALHKRAAQVQKSFLASVVGEVVVGQDSEPMPALALPDRDMSRFIVVPPLQLDRTRREAFFLDDSERVIILSRGETAVLSSLMCNPNKVVSCEYLVLATWGYELSPLEANNVIRPYIFRLRAKLEYDVDSPQLILTHRGRGYQFVSAHQDAITHTITESPND